PTPLGPGAQPPVADPNAAPAQPLGEGRPQPVQRPRPTQPAPAAPPPQASEAKIAQPIATFSGLDKITGRIISFDVAIDET
ncbi:hypothetical protein KC216_22130, partial [Mycobacterium tuberculosis]|nr:hypothetical protein [Mycobacterium tuberculosis]